MERAWGDLCRRGSKCHLSLPPEAAGTPTPCLTVLLAVSFTAQHMLFHSIRSFCLNRFLGHITPTWHSFSHSFV